MSCTFPDFKIGNESLAFVDSFKYIGHWISNDLYDDAHNNYIKTDGPLVC